MNDSTKKFLATYSGQRLLEAYSLDTKGTWNVYGEDPNCDLGGAHSNPFLGSFEGTLEDVIEEAVQMSGFWQWGAGGRFEPAPVLLKATQVPRKAKGMSDAGNLFRLIQERTYDGNITWTGDAYLLRGIVPGSLLEMELKYHSDQRDGEWHQLTVIVNNKSVQVGSESQLKELRKYILNRPTDEALLEATEILQSLL